MEIIKDYKKTAEYLKNGKIGIIPTDTIYGISCLASSQENVEKIYEIKQRDYDKPFIILISDIKDLQEFEIPLAKDIKNILKKYWPGPVSIILEVNTESYKYLHRGMKSLAFRLPSDSNLINILKTTGPLVSTSANTSNHQSINSVSEAKIQFEEKLDFMLDKGKLNNNPSKIIEIENNIEHVIR